MVYKIIVHPQKASLVGSDPIRVAENHSTIDVGSRTSLSLHQCIPYSIPGPGALCALRFQSKLAFTGFPRALRFSSCSKLERKISGHNGNKLL